jgi:dolichyl-phosphate beta-glucosyltransferase
MVVVPCFNEARRLRPELFRPLLEGDGRALLFVDDGSTDSTQEVLGRALSLLGPRARALRLERNQGKAEAVRRGLLAALEAGARVVGYFDADLATPPGEMVRLMALLDDEALAVALGSRVALLGRRIARKAYRHYLGRVFATMASVILGLRVYDTQCGAKAFRATPQLRAALAAPFHARWAFDVELIGRLLAGAAGLAGLPETAFVEMPLSRWEDVAGSTLRPFAFPRLGLELVRISCALRRLRRATRNRSS